MLPDLIRALSAAFLVGFVPGWFWARCLCASADRAERLTYAVALSMALVPAVALVPARVFGTGVTLAVAASSALLVFVAGLLAYLRFGPAKGSDEPLVSGYNPPGLPVLILLVPAFGLALWAGSQMVPGQRVMLPVALLTTTALLVLFAGIVHLVASLREPWVQELYPAEAFPGTGSPFARRAFLPAVLLLVLARGYVGPAIHDWPFMRGVDHYSHAVMANLMMTRGEIEPYLIYPPGFHTLVASVSRLSGLRPLEVFPVLAPALLLLPALAFVTILRSLGPRRPAALYVASLVVLLVGSLVGFRAMQSLENASGPSVQLTITPEIAAAGEWLREHNDGGNIMVSPHANQVPSRMMLAMGEYSALQSFEAHQIKTPRDLPPTGPEPLWDVLWVMWHPDGEHTRQLLKEHDVRYIVLYKNMPDRPTFDFWKSFKARPDLYRTTFENDDILIVARRETVKPPP